MLSKKMGQKIVISGAPLPFWRAQELFFLWVVVRMSDFSSQMEK